MLSGLWSYAALAVQRAVLRAVRLVAQLAAKLPPASLPFLTVNSQQRTFVARHRSKMKKQTRSGTDRAGYVTGQALGSSSG